MIAIIGVLVALLLPAVQAARESARKTQCRNNLKQIGLGFLEHLEAQGHFPTGGWGWKWVGDPERGYGAAQPGGWVYNILEYIEQRQMHDGRGNFFPSFFVGEGALEQVTTPIPLFNCPSRRPAQLYPFNDNFGYLAHNMIQCNGGECSVARSDYRVVSGSKDILTGEGLKIGKAHEYDRNGDWPVPKDADGISFRHGAVKMKSVTDGASLTAMVGEKFLESDHYEDGGVSYDDQCMMIGHDQDMHGYTGTVTTPLVPLQDAPKDTFPEDTELRWRFGSAHAHGIHMVFCDGSVRTILYDVEPKIFQAYGSRNGGEKGL